VRLISPEAAIRVNQSAITGSELAVLKHYGDTCFALAGSLTATHLYVIKTGRRSFVGNALEIFEDPVPSKFVIAHEMIRKQYLHTIQYFSLLLLIVVIFLGFISISIGSIFLHQESMASPTPARHLLSCMLGLVTILSGVTTRSRNGSINNIVIHSATSVECLAGVDILCTM
jgi:magnesium-transporting ATPase (P-type)